MHEFEYCAPCNLDEVIGLLSDHHGSASMLAGGTDLIVMMRGGRKRPRLLVDVKTVAEMNRLSIDEDERLILGSAVSCRRFAEEGDTSARLPALADSARLIGGIQIQGRATIGGNLCNAAPSADTLPSLIAHGAIAHVTGNQGSRDVPVEQFCVAPGRTCLNEDEVLVNLSMPLPRRHAGSAFLRFIPRNEMDIAVANAAVAVELDDSGSIIEAARVAIGAVAPTPLLVREAGAALAGRTATGESIAQAARIAREAAVPITDMRGTGEHRRQLVEVLVGRAARLAIARAGGELS